MEVSHETFKGDLGSAQKEEGLVRQIRRGKWAVIVKSVTCDRCEKTWSKQDCWNDNGYYDHPLETCQFCGESFCGECLRRHDCYGHTAEERECEGGCKKWHPISELKIEDGLPFCKDCLKKMGEERMADPKNNQEIEKEINKIKESVVLHLETLTDILKKSQTPLQIEGAIYTLAKYGERLGPISLDVYKLNEKLAQ